MSAPHMPMMNDEGLLECPFCGSNDAYSDSQGDDFSLPAQSVAMELTTGYYWMTP